MRGKRRKARADSLDIDHRTMLEQAPTRFLVPDSLVSRQALRSFSPPPIPVSLIHQPRRSQPLKRRAFLDFVAPRLTVALVKVDQAVSAK
jgi:hypothetical protein